MNLNRPRKFHILTFFLFFIASLISLGANADDLRIHFIDIGQGDSALIQSPTNKVVLIDSGPSKSKTVLFTYLKKLDIKQIDLMINSHPHADHIGNAAAIIREFKVKTILDSGFNHPIRAYRNLLSQAEESKAKIRLGRKGRVIQIGGGAFIEILAPGDTFLKNSRSDPNANSIVFRLVYKDHSVLFTGDAEEETEHLLLQDPKTLKASVLKVAHHGSRHASSLSFLKAVSPEFAVISCSQGNRYGHPAEDTLHRLGQYSIKTWVTAQQGTLMGSSDGHTWTWKGTWKDHSNFKSQYTFVPKPPPTSSEKKIHPSKSSASLVSSSATSHLISINQASSKQLQNLPRIGPKLAQRIIDYRKANGPFQVIDDLTKVRGIGAKTLARLRPLIKL